MRGGLGWVCATGMYCSIGQVEFPKLQTRTFVEWKAPILLNINSPSTNVIKQIK